MRTIFPARQVKDFSDFLTELDAGRPGGQVHVTEREDRLAEVADTPWRPIGEAFPRAHRGPACQDLSRAVMTAVGSCPSLETRLDRRLPLDVGIEHGQEGVQIIGIPRLDGALDGLHVLLRHCPRSIPRGGAWRRSRARCDGPVSGQGVPGGVVHELPADLSEALQANATALDAWNDITPLARNEFICWVEDAKQDTTRARRIRRTQEELEEGQRRPCCWPGCKHRDRTGK